MSWLSRFRPVRSLDEIPPEGAHVDVELVVASPDVLTSPIAPTCAAAIHWTLLEAASTQSMYGPMQILRPLGAGWRGDSLLARSSSGTSLEISLLGARLHSIYVDTQEGAPVQGEAATVYGDAIARLARPRHGMLLARELAITHGQRLRVKAFVLPNERSSPGYREASSEAVADLRAVRAVHLYDG